MYAVAQGLDIDALTYGHWRQSVENENVRWKLSAHPEPMQKNLD